MGRGSRCFYNGQEDQLQYQGHHNWSPEEFRKRSTMIPVGFPGRRLHAVGSLQDEQKNQSRRWPLILRTYIYACMRHISLLPAFRNLTTLTIRTLFDRVHRGFQDRYPAISRNGYWVHHSYLVHERYSFELPSIKPTQVGLLTA